MSIQKRLLVRVDKTFCGCLQCMFDCKHVFLDSRKSFFNIFYDVVDILKSATESYHASVDSCCNKLFVGKLTVSCTCRMKNACPDVGNVYFVACKFKSVHKSYGSRASAFYTYGNYT